MAECVPQGMAMVGNRRVMMGLELKGFVPVAFATLLEAQIWETGMATDLRGPTPFLLSLAATLAVGSVCSPVGQAGAAGALQGAVPWRGGLTLRCCSWAQPWLCNMSPSGSVSAPLKYPKWHHKGFASSWGGKHDHNKGGFNVNTLLQLILKLPLQL